MKLSFAAAVLLFVFSSVLARVEDSPARQALTVPPMAVKHSTLANGLQVYSVEDHKSPTVAVQVWYHVGSKDDPNDVEARDMCQKCAWKASLAIVRGVPMGASHAIGHILGPLGVGHGHTSCVMMPAAMRFNYKVNSKQQEKIKQILTDKGVVKQLGLDESAEPWQIMSKFIRRIGMPQSLGEVGVHEDKFEKISKDVLGDFWSQTNPIPLKQDMVMEILQYAK